MVQTRDRFNAFLDYLPVDVAAASEGPLAGLTLAVKDIYDVAGYPTGCGNPIREKEGGPAGENAAAVQCLLDAGAWFVGKTQTDELAFSLTGYNKHFAQAVNPRAQGRITGGSSCGSAAAVAGGLCDVALGTDTGGSIRAPASFCGLWGIRPTHGRVPSQGIMPLAPTFDTPGYFADSGNVFELVARAFLGDDPRDFVFTRLLWGRKSFSAVVDVETMDVLTAAERAVAGQLGSAEPVDDAPIPLDRAYEAFRTLQAAEAWAHHGAWIRDRNPDMTPGVRERFEYGATVDQEQIEAANHDREYVRTYLQHLLGGDALMMIPTTPIVAPPIDMDAATLNAFRSRCLPLLSLSGLSGLPQVSIPLGRVSGRPIGMSILGPRGSDRALIEFCVRLKP